MRPAVEYPRTKYQNKLQIYIHCNQLLRPGSPHQSQTRLQWRQHPSVLPARRGQYTMRSPGRLVTSKTVIEMEILKYMI